MEVKKFFMDEWTGAVDEELAEALGLAVLQAGAAVEDELGNFRSARVLELLSDSDKLRLTARVAQ